MLYGVKYKCKDRTKYRWGTYMGGDIAAYTDINQPYKYMSTLDYDYYIEEITSNLKYKIYK